MQAPLKQIQLLLLDVDGVLTDGQITYTDSGEQVKSFYSKDGLGLRMLMDAGVQVGIVTGRTSKALIHRCHNLGIDLIFDGIKDKSRALDQIVSKTQISASHMGFAGDDLIDLPAMTRVGTCFAPSDAVAEVKARSDYICCHPGGRGAVREICEAILKARGQWEAAVSGFLP